MITTAPGLTRSDIETMWDYLKHLGSESIPSDLSEIDAAWVYGTLQDSDDEHLEGLASAASYHVIDGLAYDLRDLWHAAAAEVLDWRKWGHCLYD